LNRRVTVEYQNNSPRGRGDSRRVTVENPGYNNQQQRGGRPSKYINRLGTKRLNVHEEPEPSIHTPYFVGLCFLVNCIMLVVEMYRNNWQFEPLSVNPMYGPSTQTLQDLGAKLSSLILDGQYYRFVSAMFLHGGVIHLLFNMSALIRVGKDLEQAFGTWRIVVIYMLSGIYGNLLSCIFLPDVLGVGASGALFGFLGAMFGDFFQNYKSFQESRWRYFASLCLNAVLGLLFGLMPWLDNFQHVGGFIMGILLGSMLLSLKVKDPRTKKIQHNRFLILTCAALFIVAVVVGFSVFYSGVDGNAWCSYCHYISCVQTPWWQCPEICTGFNATTGQYTDCQTR